MRILVTGAAGFIGSHVSEKLSAAGHHVVGMDNFDPLYSRRVKESNLNWPSSAGKFDFWEGDILGTWAPANIDCIVHMAAKAGIGFSLENPMSYQRANVLGTQMVMHLAHKHGVKKVILASSSSIYGDTNPPLCEETQVPMPISPYAASKVGMEAIGQVSARLHGMSVLALRLFTVYGPRQRPDLAMYRFAEMMSADEKIEIFGEGTSRDYTYIDDIVEGIVLAVEADIPGFQAINLGGGDSVTPLQVIESMSKLLRVTPKVDTTGMRDGDVTRTLASVHKAKVLLGWEPKTRLADGLDRFVSWFSKSAQNKILDRI